MDPIYMAAAMGWADCVDLLKAAGGEVSRNHYQPYVDNHNLNFKQFETLAIRLPALADSVSPT